MTSFKPQYIKRVTTNPTSVGLVGLVVLLDWLEQLDWLCGRRAVVLVVVASAKEIQEDIRTRSVVTVGWVTGFQERVDEEIFLRFMIVR